MLQRDYYVGDYIGRHASGNNFVKFRKNFLDDEGGKTPKLHYKWTFQQVDSKNWTRWLTMKPLLYGAACVATAGLAWKIPRWLNAHD